MPGLATKPPLPNKKSEINKTDTEKIETVCDESSSKNKEVMFQNWITEEEELESEILLSERQTDRYFDSLKNDNTATAMKIDEVERKSDLEEENSESCCSGVVEDNGTYDDIVTLLKILEDQDKKSRNAIQLRLF